MKTIYNIKDLIDPCNRSEEISMALVTGSLSHLSGGMFYSARIPANRLAAHGIRVDVHGLADHDWMRAQDDWHVSSITAHPVLGLARIGFSPSMLRSVHTGIDLVHLRGLWGFPSFVASRLRRAQVPLVISPEGMLSQWALRRSSVKKQIATWLFEGANIHGASVMHALNHSEADDIRRYGYKGPIAVIPNGAEMDRTVAVGKKTEDRRTLLFLGRIHPKKGLKELIFAWARAVEAHPALAREWRIDIAGWDDGAHRQSLERLIAEVGAAANIAFVGALYGNEKAQALSNASAFILPSFSEGLPISVLEAWSYGLPVLMTDACNLSEGFVEGAASRIHLDDRFADELANWLRQPPEVMEQMGACGEKLVRERYDWEVLTGKFAELYRWVAGRGDRPACIRMD